MKRSSALYSRHLLLNDLRASSSSFLLASNTTGVMSTCLAFRHSGRVIASGRTYANSAAQDILDAFKSELDEIKDERQDRNKFVNDYLGKHKFSIEKSEDLDSVKIARREKGQEITLVCKAAEKKEEEPDKEEEAEKTEQNDFSLEIKQGESVLRLDGWTEGDTFDIDKIVIGKYERYMEEDGDEEVSRFKAYLSEVTGFKEPDFPHAVADLLELNALDKDQKWNEELSRFVKHK